VTGLPIDNPLECGFSGDSTPVSLRPALVVRPAATKSKVADGQEGPDDLTQRDDCRQNSDKGVLSPETSVFMMIG